MQSPTLPGHLSEFSLGEIALATAWNPETQDQQARRIAAIRAMYEGYAPRDSTEDTLVSQIIIVRFRVVEAMKGLARLTPGSRELDRAQKAAAGLSRMLLSWVRQFEQRRARDARQQAEAAEQAGAAAQDKPKEPARSDATAPQSARPPAPPEPPRAAAAAQAIRPPASVADASKSIQTGTLTLRPANGGGATAAAIVPAKASPGGAVSPSRA
jgi:hypothetical protein